MGGRWFPRLGMIATSGAGATLSVVPAPETVIFLNESPPTRHIPDTVWILMDARDRQLGREMPVLWHFPAQTVIMTSRFPQPDTVTIPDNRAPQPPGLMPRISDGGH